jgi:peptidoglycan-associated lipoprotein
MKMDRKWIILVVPAVLLLAAGCGSAPPPPPKAPPPPVMSAPPATDVDSSARPASEVDEREMRPPQSIQELQDEYNRSGLLGDVFFGFDEFELRPDARERLQKNAEFMGSAEGRGLTFVVEGHCDERGTNEYNIALGQNRSTTAVDYLISLGVSAARFRTISYGEERPFCTESTEACWQKNRRARFVISGTTG